MPYQNYTQAQLELAKMAISGGAMSTRAASKLYNVPRTTIRDHASGKIFPGARAGRKPKIPPKIEDQFAKKVVEAASIGIGLTKQQVVSRIGEISKIIPGCDTKAKAPGHGWWRGFKKRYPEIVLRQPEPLAKNRAEAMTKYVVLNYFKDLSKLLDLVDIDPARIWNIDEKGFMLTHNPPKVVARRGMKALPARVGNNRESVTVLGVSSADGNILPPMIIVPGKTRRSLYAYDCMSGPVNALWTYQAKGFMTEDLMCEWFNEIYLKNIGDRRPQLLLLDSHISHESFKLIDSARANGILLLTFPPHCTHWLQPWDVSLFGPMGRAYNKYCHEFMTESLSHMVTKWDFPRLLRQSWEEAATTQNVISGFDKCGIFPWDPSRIPEHAYAPSGEATAPASHTTTTTTQYPENVELPTTTCIAAMPMSQPIEEPIPTTSTTSTLTTITMEENDEVAIDIDDSDINMHLLEQLEKLQSEAQSNTSMSFDSISVSPIIDLTATVNDIVIPAAKKIKPIDLKMAEAAVFSSIMASDVKYGGSWLVKSRGRPVIIDDTLIKHHSICITFACKNQCSEYVRKHLLVYYTLY